MKNINIREVEGGYYIKLNGLGRKSREWVTKDKEEVVKILRREFFEELSAENRAKLEEGIKEVEEYERRTGKKKTEK